MPVNVGLEIRVVDPDDDYLGIEVSVATDRFAGSARIFAGLNQLSELADSLRGFPSSPADKRRFELGTRKPGYAGGFVSLSFYCRDGAGHSEVAVEIDDDVQYYAKASACFSFAFEPAALDQFLAVLSILERTKSGHATLVPAG
jgi:hypothetical protein